MSLRSEALARSHAPAGGTEARVVALDGLRGFMTILVVLSHYFAEVPNGIPVLMAGWVAVDMFFVLSGYLVGRMILEKKHSANFLQVFFMRRACRTLPIYFVAVLVVFALQVLIDRPWTEAELAFPLWSYLTFTQNALMVASNSVGSHWLAPTWTLGLEEHFYIVVPFLFLLVPRRRLTAVFLAIALGAVIFRALIVVFAPSWTIATLVLLPARADILTCGILAALAVRSTRFDWTQFIPLLRYGAPILLVVASCVKLWTGEAGLAMSVLSPLLVSLACTAFLLTLVGDAPEAVRFRSPILCFFGTTSYAVYLMHMPILGLMHGFLLGAKPDVGTPIQWLVTLASLPICVLVGWLLTRWVEAPLTAYGRTWTWRTHPFPVPHERTRPLTAA
jgi:peptidoglycan/LPS O-acetylase OafA/YrhL